MQVLETSLFVRPRDNKCRSPYDAGNVLNEHELPVAMQIALGPIRDCLQLALVSSYKVN